MNKKSRCVIISAAEIKNYENIKTYLKKDDFNIFCDAGLNHQEALGITPNLIIGDFDSTENPNSSVETIVLPSVKDDTDTFFAIKEGIKRGFETFLLIGVIGNRLDHSLCNISALQFLYENKKSATILDDYSEITIADKNHQYIEDSYKYFSLMNICGDVKGVNIKNAKYPLTDGEIKSSYQYGISNEVLPGKKAEIWVEEGLLLLFKIR